MINVQELIDLNIASGMSKKEAIVEAKKELIEKKQNLIKSIELKKQHESRYTNLNT